MGRSEFEELRQLIREIATLNLGYPRTIHVGSFPISVEVAATPEEQELGLMHRQHLDPDCGMLFRYDEPQDLSFWMRNTHIPLSIAFIDDEGRITGINDMDPHDETRVISPMPCRWALETNRGWFGDRKIRIGARVSGLDV